MMGRDEFLRKFADELRGLLAESFAQARHSQITDHSANGKLIVDQLRRGQDFLDRVYKAFQESVPVQLPTANGNGKQPVSIRSSAS